MSSLPNYERWEVWKLEEEIEALMKRKEETRILMRHITRVRDAKLARGESQKRPAGRVERADKRPAWWERLMGKKEKASPGSDQIVTDAGGIESRESVHG